MRLILMLAGLVALSAAAGCDHFYGIHGRVTSCADHQPVPDARAKLYLSEDDNEEGAAQPDGTFGVMLNHPYSSEESKLSVSAPGYQTAERSVKPSDAGEDVCLEPAAAP